MHHLSDMDEGQRAVPAQTQRDATTCSPDALLGYWQTVFTKTPATHFEGRGWGKVPCKNGQQSKEVNQENIVHLSDYAHVHPTGKTGCDHMKAAN